MTFWIVLGGIVSVGGLVVSIIAIIKAGGANKIAKAAHDYTVGVDKERKKIDKENILKAIEIIEKVLQKWKVNLQNVGNEYAYGEAHWHGNYPERFKPDLEEIIQYYAQHIQVKLRHAIQPFYDDRAPDRDFARFKKRCQEVREKFAELKEDP